MFESKNQTRRAFRCRHMLPQIQSLESRVYCISRAAHAPSATPDNTAALSLAFGSAVPAGLLPAAEQGRFRLEVDVTDSSHAHFSGPVQLNLSALPVGSSTGAGVFLAAFHRNIRVQPNKSTSLNIIVPGLPSTVTNGKYYFLAEIVNADGLASNSATSLAAVNVGPPSVALTSFAFVSPQAAGGGSLAAKIVIHNTGPTLAKGSIPIALYAWSFPTSTPPTATSSSGTSSTQTSTTTTSTGNTGGSTTTNVGANGSLTTNTRNTSSGSTGVNSTANTGTDGSSTGGSTVTMTGPNGTATTSTNSASTGTTGGSFTTDTGANGSSTSNTTTTSSATTTSSFSNNTFIPLVVATGNLDIRPGGTKAVNVRFIVPPTFPNGSYWLVGQVVPNDVVVQEPSPSPTNAPGAGPTNGLTNNPASLVGNNLLLFSSSTFTLYGGGTGM